MLGTGGDSERERNHPELPVEFTPSGVHDECAFIVFLSLQSLALKVMLIRK